MSDKNQAVIDFLFNCPTINANPLFFNFLNAKDNSKQLITMANDVSLNRKFVDGGVLKRYTFTIVDFRSIVYQAVPRNTVIPGTTTYTDYVSENVEEMNMVQGIMDWINEQGEAQNFPDFGSDCIIEEMKTTSENPNLNGVDTSSSPPLAKYSMSIQIDYIDKSKAVWT